MADLENNMKRAMSKVTGKMRKKGAGKFPKYKGKKVPKGNPFGRKGGGNKPSLKDIFK